MAHIFIWFMLLVVHRIKGIHQPEISFHNVDKVWGKGITGKGVVVAVVDDGNETLSFDFISDVHQTKVHTISSHGTRCAGVIAAKQRGKCRSGIAYNAQVADLKIISSQNSYAKSMSKALQYKQKEIHIYSNSWGPADDGYTVGGPGKFIEMSLEKGARQGREGRGSIFVFSAGNGGRYRDSCAFDGYVNSMYTIGIGAVTKSSDVPFYAEPCSSVIATTYGDDVNTCDIGGCTSNFGKTSSAATMASGILALLLEVNNALTWRDVQHLIVRTSKPPRKENELGKKWIINGAGLMVHPYLGFGVMDAEKLVEAAVCTKWKSVPAQKHCSIQFNESKKFNREQNSFIIAPEIMYDCSKIKYIEHVKVEMSLSFAKRGSLEMFLKSPHGTQSQIIYARPLDILARQKSYSGLAVTTLHFWGENPTVAPGNWKLAFKSRVFRYGNFQGSLWKFKMTIYGTKENPIFGSKLNKGVIHCEYKNSGKKRFWKGYGSKCCGNLGVYDESKVNCCNGRFVHGRTDMCGSFKYDECTQICCNGVIHAKMGRATTCCNKYAYDMSTQICCNGRPITKYRCIGMSINLEAKCRNGLPVYHRNWKACNRKQEIFSLHHVCSDKAGRGRCEYWKMRGYCRTHGSQTYCRKTCNYCS